MTASTGRHWRTEVIPAVDEHRGSFSGSLAGLLLEETAPFEPPTHEFSVADVEFARRIDAQIAAARVAERRRLTGPARHARPSRWARARRYVKVNWTPGRAAYVAATGGSFLGGLVTWLVAR